MLVGCKSSCFFFQNSISDIHNHFEVLFEKADEEVESEENGNQTNGGQFGQYGLLPCILRVCNESNSPFDTVMGWPVCQTFYIASYIVTKNKYEQDQIKQMQLKNKVRR